MDDVLILGGGVIGLSLAYELSQSGMRVRVLDRAMPGQEASWAGAGILVAPARAATTPFAQLSTLSYDRHLAWAAQLREETGIDNGLQICGGVYVARGPKATAELHQLQALWQQEGTVCERLDPASALDCLPGLREHASKTDVRGVLHTPQEGQIRNPRHLKALLTACQSRGVTVEPCVAAEQIRWHGQQVQGVETPLGLRQAGQYVICGGAWSRSLMQQVNVQVPIYPVRGQMALLQTNGPAQLKQIVNEGARYLVPRTDGRVLVGSTEEQVGFDKRTTAAAISGLLALAVELVPALASAHLERSWSGLRPGTPDRLPYVGRVEGLENLWMAAGHFRNGLQLSTGTALVLSSLICGEPTSLDIGAFALNRTLPA